MNSTHKNLLLIVLIASAFFSNLFAQRPLLEHIYAADPSAHIWPTDTNVLWLYTSHDVAGTNHHATMFDYHVFSTTDLIHWTDYGRVFSVDDADWAETHAWAIDAAFWQGKYYLVYCMIESATGIFRTGLATSNKPQGPFEDIGYIEGVEWGQDPCLFIDKDNTPYLFWGAGGECHAATLTNDLRSIIPETLVNLTGQLYEVYEGPWVHIYQDKYYLSYPALTGGKWPEEMVYAIADKPLGPYLFKGKYIPEFEGQAGTNHGSIIKYKGKWIAFHHAAILSGGMGHVRNLMADYLEYNTEGTIKPIIPNDAGITSGKPTIVNIHLEAENGKAAGGKLAGTNVSVESPGFSGDGYVTGFDNQYDYVSVLVQVARDMKANLSIRLSANADFLADVLVDVIMLDGWDGTPMKKTNGWETVNAGEIHLKAGDNIIRFGSRNDVNLKVDYFRIKPEL